MSQTLHELIGRAFDSEIAKRSTQIRLGVRATSTCLVILINGHEVCRAYDDLSWNEELGLAVGSRANAPAQARFSRLVVASVT
jgi:hypothetical protein